MDHVEPEQQRDPEPRLLHREALQRVRLARAAQIQDRADLSGGDHVLDGPTTRRRPRRMTVRKLIELPDLLAQRHARE